MSAVIRYPLGPELLDAATWAQLYEEQADRSLWCATALGAATQMLHDPEIFAIVQRNPDFARALGQIDDGPDGETPA